MGERAKIILNEYSAKNLLMRDTLDLDKFYTADLKLFVEVARKEIERLNNIINEFNSSYYKIIKECEEMINDRYYMNENAIKYHANRIRDIAKYYIEEPKWQELKGEDKE